ncbi:thiamine phosphate synthase [Hoeflea sp. CAU 1731]
MTSRCRLVLIAPPIADPDALASLLGDALRGGDVATVVLPQGDLNEVDFQNLAARAVPVIQERGVAALVCGEERIAMRVKADGLHIDGPATALRESVEKHAPQLIVGGGNPQTRHAALDAGEAQPDYVFFGKLRGDIKPEPHSKNLALAEWWSEIVQIPSLVMGGLDPESALTVAEHGADFVALGSAVFAEPAQSAQIVAAVNALLDEKAPRFDD